MICVYILKSQKDHDRYIGSTSDLHRRLKEHYEGKVSSTKNRRPLVLFGYQECNDLTQARILESKYKKSRGTYNKAIKNCTIKTVM